ncbi:MAG: ATPase [Treponema sp.]|nr:ATPase [Treponema sp.]
MIVPMKKVSVVLLANERKTALESLRKLGVLHVEELTGASEQLTAFRQALSDAQAALSVLSGIKLPKGATVPTGLSAERAQSVCESVIAQAARKKELFEKIAAATVELERFSEWGDVDPDDFAYLKGKGISLRLFEIPAGKYASIPEAIDTVLVNTSRKQSRFLLLGCPEGRPDGLPPEAFEVALPHVSTSMLRDEIAACQTALALITDDLAANAVYAPAIRAYAAALEKDVEFENIYAGMGTETDEPVALAWLSGFVPVDAYDSLKECARSNSWALLADDPAEDDAVPTKLKNNRLVSMIYPLTDFLGTVPGYREFDISGWFLLFFAVFFGMIFGDAGYGALIVLGVLGTIIKNAVQGKKWNPGYGLFLLLGLSTVAWGTVTCTWFGLTPEYIPAFLKQLSLPPISNAYADQYDGIHSLLTTSQNLMLFCFVLAFLQLSIAHLKCIVRNIRSLKVFGDIGSLFMLWGMCYVVLSLVVNGDVFPLDLVYNGIPVGRVAIMLIAVGFVLGFVFSNYAGNIGASVLESCKNIITVILGVVNVFSDVISYIRLWAVGLAGGAISNTVNTMAGPLASHALLFVAFVALLVFGHGLNVILNVLSVIVHGVRLNTLEFSTHLGMEWSGYKYAPFAETAEK